MKKFKSLFLMLMAAMPLVSNASEKPETGMAMAMQSQPSAQKQAGKGALAAFDLYGNVKKVVINRDGEMHETLEFDTDGKLVKVYNSYDRDYYKGIKYDANGRLASYLQGDVQNGKLQDGSTTQFIYGANGILLKRVETREGDGNGKSTFTFVRNAASRVIKEHEVGRITLMDDTTEPINENTTYKYNASDANGNWTSRSVNGSWSYTETRTIEYY